MPSALLLKSTLYTCPDFRGHYSPWKIGLATSQDGIAWTRYPGNPVLDIGPSGGWEDYAVGNPFVLHDGTEYKIWYYGCRQGDPHIRIGYATSPDGIVWTKHPGNPVLDVGPPGAWDDYTIYSPTVLFDGTEYKMWYHGTDGSTFRIGYATSPDGIIWTKHPGNPVLDVGPPGGWDDYLVMSPTVLFDGTEYKMWYRGGDGSTDRIGYATSLDGINWVKFIDNPVLDIGPSGSWEDDWLGSPDVLVDEGMYKMWYVGNDHSTDINGYAISLPECWDQDSDGSWDEACGGWDCDDSDPDVHLGAIEVCDDTVDNDCDDLIDDRDPDCFPEFILEMDASYTSGTLNLDFTLGTEYESVWANYLILTSPSIQFIHLWTILLPVVVPPVDIPVSFPFSSDGWLGVYSAIYIEGVREIFALEWVATGK